MRPTDRLRRLSTEAFVMLVGQAATALLSIGAVKLMTRALGAEEYGRLALGMTLPFLLNQAAFGPLGVAVMRHHEICRETGDLRPLAAAARRSTLRLGTAAVLLVGPLCFVVWQREGRAWGVLFLGMLAYGIAQNAQSLFTVAHNAARERLRAAVAQAIDPAVRLLLAAGAMVVGLSSASTVAVGLAVLMAFATVAQHSLHWRSLPRGGGDPRAIERRLWSYGRFVAGWGAFSWLPTVADRWSLKAHGTDSDVGLYAYAFQLASLPSVIVAGAFGQFLNPIIFQRAGDATDTERRVSAARAAWLGTLAPAVWVAGCAAVAALWGEPIAVAFASESFRPAGALLWPLVVGLGAMQVANAVGIVPLFVNRMRTHLVIKVVVALASLPLFVYGARMAGARGVAFAAIVLGALHLLLATANGMRLLRTSPAGDVTGQPSDA